MINYLPNRKRVLPREKLYRTVTVLFPFLFSLIVIVFSSCGNDTVTLAPPDWILGTWQSDTSDAADYVIWEFTADNAVYEYHDPDNNIHSTIDLQTDLPDSWVRDEVLDDGYEILIDRNTHSFSPELDENTELNDNSTITIIEYSASGLFSGESWELIKQ